MKGGREGVGRGEGRDEDVGELGGGGRSKGGKTLRYQREGKSVNEERGAG